MSFDGMYDKPSREFRGLISDIKIGWNQKTIHPICPCGCNGSWNIFRGFKMVPKSILQRLNPLWRLNNLIRREHFNTIQDHHKEHKNYDLYESGYLEWMNWSPENLHKRFPNGELKVRS